MSPTPCSFVEPLDPPPDPVWAAGRVASLPYPTFLDSASRSGGLGRYSFLMADPVVLVRARGGRTERLDTGAGEWRRVAGDALSLIGEYMSTHRRDPVPGLPPFQGGAAGFLSYEWGRSLEPRLPEPQFDDLDLPDVLLGVYDWVVAWDHVEARVWLVSTGLPETSPEACARRAAARAASVRGLLGAGEAGSRSADARSDRSSGVEPVRTYPVEANDWSKRVGLRSSFTHAGYLEAVNRVREYILAGDIFQANLSQRFEAPLAEPAWDLYRRLRTRNAAPFAAYLDLGDAVVMSASPERFLRLDVGGRVETRPIKGTRPRGVGPEHDAALGLALRESAKDRAENLMIVDLMRNDLSRVSMPGTVRIEELFVLERYASVHHLVSTVSGRLRPGAGARDLLSAAFPGGSITGAPKIRAMEIITELEKVARGVYCGAIGYWSLTGALDMNIPIRTAVARGGRVCFNAGGGIVADSDPELEYRETLDKARGIVDALASLP